MTAKQTTMTAKQTIDQIRELLLSYGETANDTRHPAELLVAIIQIIGTYDNHRNDYSHLSRVDPALLKAAIAHNASPHTND